MLAFIVSNLSSAGGTLEESTVLMRALRAVNMSQIIDNASARGDADAGVHSSVGPTGLSWAREAVVGDQGSDEDVIKLTQRFDLSGRPEFRAEAAKAAGLSARHSAEVFKLEYTSHIRLLFHRCKSAKQRLDAHASWTEGLRDVGLRIKQRAESGAEPEWVSQHSEHEIARGVIQMKRTQAEHDAIMAELLALMQWEDGMPPPTLIAPALPSLAPGGLSAYLDNLRHHPSALALKAQQKSASLREDAGKRAWVPEVEVSLGFKRAGGKEEQGQGYAAGANLVLPLSGGAHAESSQARADYQRASRALSLWQLHQSAKTKNAYLRAERLIQIAKEAEAHLEEDRQRMLTTAHNAYDGGELGAAELLDAYRDVRDDRLQAIALFEDAWKAAIHLEEISGGSW